MSINMRAIEREEQALEEQYARGEITYGEYHNAMRDLRDEIRGAAEEEAERAYNDAMGGW